MFLNIKQTPIKDKTSTLSVSRSMLTSPKNNKTHWIRLDIMSSVWETNQKLCFVLKVAHFGGLGQNDDTADSLPLNAVFRQLIVELFIQNIDQVLAQT